MIMQTLQIAALVALVSPLIIVGVGMMLGLVLAVSQVMMGVVVGMLMLFRGSSDQDWGDEE